MPQDISFKTFYNTSKEEPGALEVYVRSVSQPQVRGYVETRILIHVCDEFLVVLLTQN